MTQSTLLALQNKHILVTRPAHQASHLIELLKAVGATVSCQPLIDIVPLQQPDKASHLIKALPQTDIAIFISQNAVSHGLNLINRINELPTSLKLATIGAGSAQLLEELSGRPVDITPLGQYNSEGLLAHPELQEIQGKRIIIFRGIGGRNLLADTLRQRGAIVEYAEVYRRQAPAIDLQQLEQNWQAQPIDAICITSGEGLDNFVDALQQTPQTDSLKTIVFNCQLIIVNQRLEKRVVDYGFTKKPVITDNVSDKAIVDAIIKTFT